MPSRYVTADLPIKLEEDFDLPPGEYACQITSAIINTNGIPYITLCMRIPHEAIPMEVHNAESEQ